jgi:putative transposase
MDATKGLRTINKLAREHGVHPTQISEWKRQLLDVGDTLFNRDRTRHHRAQQEQEVELYEQIGCRKMALEWLKKKLPDSVKAQRLMIDLDVPHLSIRRQCALLGLNRSTLYSAPATASERHVRLMRLIDEPYTKTPFDVWLRLTAQGQRLGLQVNHQRAQRLMQTMGLQAIDPSHALAQPPSTIRSTRLC